NSRFKSLYPRAQLMRSTRPVFGDLFSIRDVDNHTLIGPNGDHTGPQLLAVSCDRELMPARRHDQLLVLDYVVVELVDVPHEVLRFTEIGRASCRESV